MIKLDTRRRCGNRWRHPLVPNAFRYIQDVRKMTNEFIIRRSDDYRAEVISPTHRTVVDLEAMTCSCNRWQLTGLPCSHATALIQEIRGIDIMQFIDPYYLTETYRATYEMRLNPLVDRELWERVDLPYIVLPPLSRRPRGRPKKKRIRDPNELKKNKKMHKCGRCGNWGHHRSSCKESLSTINIQGVQPRPPRKQVPRRREPFKISDLPFHRTKGRHIQGNFEVHGVNIQGAHAVAANTQPPVQTSSQVSANISESASMLFGLNSGSQ
ncbi:hypothetical protein QJS10_CPB13g01349 [Acorus calamus]|uniref:SWIM-type domain-containing protein n=1 Tax=Acorus calamus TaxID=4465 RepID=A0AAV9DAZ2_ACOCL|nr:hypothetical protein QJS10_CPB14g01540 [Acorus calamus]KAK1300090.1 hypothetical protein QJS10_CPB13g01349 [Acorus calamus]